jgi:hypothetical protein
VAQSRTGPGGAAIACLDDHAAAVPDSQLTDQPVPRSQLRETLKPNVKIIAHATALRRPSENA